MSKCANKVSLPFETILQHENKTSMKSITPKNIEQAGSQAVSVSELDFSFICEIYIPPAINKSAKTASERFSICRANTFKKLQTFSYQDTRVVGGDSNISF